MEYRVRVHGYRSNGTIVTTIITTKASNPQSAIIQTAGIDSRAVRWYSVDDTGDYYDDVIIKGYEIV